MSKLHKWGALILLLMSTCITASYAQDAELTNDNDEVTVIVTAERTPQPISESISSATVITAKKIKEMGAQTVADALRTVPGATIIQNGELGALASIRIRGTSTAQSLVMIDGRRLSSSAFGGSTDLSKIPVENIARIEVIRGPVSSLYGSDAIGGVVNIITKKPSADSAEFVLGLGTHDRVSRMMTIDGVSKNASWNISASVPKYNGSRPNSRFSATDLSGSLTLTDEHGWEIKLNTNVYNDSLGLPGSITFSSLNDHQWWKRRGSELSARRTIAGGQFEIRGYTFKQELKELNPDWYTDSLITGNTSAAEMTYAKSFGAHQMVFGTEYRDEDYRDIESKVKVQEKGIINKAVFLQDRTSIGTRADLVAGVRYDDHSVAGDRVTPRVGLTYDLGKNTILRTSYSEGFRAPSLVELYYNNYGSHGNPNLRPEKSKQYEVGMSTKLGHNTLDLALFTGKVRDQIAYVLTDPVYFTGTFENLERTKQRGVEFTWSRPIDKLTDIALSYTYTDARNTKTDSRINGIPYNQAGISISRRISNFDLALTGRYVGDRLFSGVKTSSYTVFDLYLAQNRNSTIKPYLMIRNLLNESYDEVAGYPAEGRSFELGIRSSW